MRNADLEVTWVDLTKADLEFLGEISSDQDLHLIANAIMRSRIFSLVDGRMPRIGVMANKTSTGYDRRVSWAHDVELRSPHPGAAATHVFGVLGPWIDEIAFEWGPEGPMKRFIMATLIASFVGRPTGLQIELLN